MTGARREERPADGAAATVVPFRGGPGRAERPPAPARPGRSLDAHVVVERGGFTLDARLVVGPGEVVAVLGPNGAGKTTLLRALAGLLPLTRGHVRTTARATGPGPAADDGTPGTTTWDDPAAGVLVPATDRGVGLLFQDYRLFPHLSVLDNVAFGARARGVRRRTARALAFPWLDRVGVADLAARRPGTLSGGQAQRVALARALASSPVLLLLDEPLAALDAATRLDVRAELRRHLAAFDGPTLVVTHDPLEAMVLADRVVVLEAGRVVQDGPPAAVARRPATDYVARLMGLNLYTGILVDPATHRIELDSGGVLTASGADAELGTPAGAAGGQRVLAVIAPSAISVHMHRPEDFSPRNVWPAVVTGIELLNDRVRLATEGRPSALVDVTPGAVADLHLESGTRVWLSAKASEVTSYPDPGRAPLVL